MTGNNYRVAPALVNGGGEYFFHRQVSAAARSEVLLVAAVGPDGMRDSIEGHKALIIAVLVAVIDGVAWKEPVAIVLIRAGGADTNVG